MQVPYILFSGKFRILRGLPSNSVVFLAVPIISLLPISLISLQTRKLSYLNRSVKERTSQRQRIKSAQKKRERKYSRTKALAASSDGALDISAGSGGWTGQLPCAPCRRTAAMPRGLPGGCFCAWAAPITLEKTEAAAAGLLGGVPCEAYAAHHHQSDQLHVYRDSNCRANLIPLP